MPTYLLLFLVKITFVLPFIPSKKSLLALRIFQARGLRKKIICAILGKRRLSLEATRSSRTKGKFEDKLKDKEEENLVHDFKGEEGSFLSMRLVIFLIIVAVLGIGTGYYLAQNKSGAGPLFAVTNSKGESSASKGVIVGSDDTKTFKDSAEGVLKEGGIEGEGQFHLVRPGGDSQNVYMTSSLVDLSKYINKKVKVWGQTQKAKTAGWLMDVGRLEVLK